MEKTELHEYEHPTYALSNEEAHRQTIESIEIALTVLLEKKAISEISITEISKMAGVSRGAFYRNYETKEDVLKQIVLRHAQNTYELCFPYLNEQNTRKYWVGLFTYALEHRDFYSLISRKETAEYISEYTEYIAYHIFKGPKPANKYTLSFSIGAVSKVFYDWVNNGMAESPEEMAVFIENAMPK